MMTFLIYEAKVAVLLAVFYIFYRLLLSRETLHRLNRAVLLGIVALSFVLPLCVITIHRLVPVVAGADVHDVAAAVAGNSWWQMAIVPAYLIGVAAVIAKVTASLAGVVRVIRNTEVETASDGTLVNVTDVPASPFSWMSHIVMSR